MSMNTYLSTRIHKKFSSVSLLIVIVLKYRIWCRKSMLECHDKKRARYLEWFANNNKYNHLQYQKWHFYAKNGINIWINKFYHQINRSIDKKSFAPVLTSVGEGRAFFEFISIFWHYPKTLRPLVFLSVRFFSWISQIHG